MIAVDSSSFIAYLQGDKGRDVEKFDQAFLNKAAILPPPVILELLSDPKIDQKIIGDILSLPVLEIGSGFWQRAAENRAKLIARKLKARLADAMIAQCCIDHDVPLITRDKDFRHFEKYCGLRIL